MAAISTLHYSTRLISPFSQKRMLLQASGITDLSVWYTLLLSSLWNLWQTCLLVGWTKWSHQTRVLSSEDASFWTISCSGLSLGLKESPSFSPWPLCPPNFGSGLALVLLFILGEWVTSYISRGCYSPSFYNPWVPLFLLNIMICSSPARSRKKKFSTQVPNSYTQKEWRIRLNIEFIIAEHQMEWQPYVPPFPIGDLGWLAAIEYFFSSSKQPPLRVGIPCYSL